MSLPGAQTTVSFTRPAYTADAVGGQVATFAALYTSLIGSLQPARGRTIEQFARRSMQIDHTFYTESALSLKAGDVATDANGVKYIVVWFEDMAGQGRYYCAHLLRKD